MSNPLDHCTAEFDMSHCKESLRRITVISSERTLKGMTGAYCNVLSQHLVWR